MQPEWPRLQSPDPQRQEGSPRMATSIKRSSWSAGMAAEFAQMAPPGSPAAWHGRRQSRALYDALGKEPGAQDSPRIEFPSLSRHNSDAHHARAASPLRSPSPVRKPQRLQVPGLESIRSVSGSAASGGTAIDDTPLKSPISSAEPAPNPFKFTSTYVTPNATRAGRSGASQRRGHHYKHSSVSLNFFQEPEERAPLAIPVSLAVPNLAEYWQSITRPQSLALARCALKLCVTLGCYSVGSPVHSMALLAHLLAYETVVSTTIALVAILANFEVWSRSSLRLPFALKRVEVLVAFGLAVVLLFIGGDVVSHIAQDWATGGHHHGGHDHDADGAELPVGKAHFVLVTLAIIMTLPTAWRDGTSNVLALSTVLFAAVVLVIPLFNHRLSGLVDTVLQPAIVATMVFVGYSSSKLFGGMLAMSYGGPDRSETIGQLVSSDPCVVKVEEISLWQVHHDLWLATMRIIMSGTAEDERRVRNQAVRAVREAVDVRDVVWETTIEIHRAATNFF